MRTRVILLLSSFVVLSLTSRAQEFTSDSLDRLLDIAEDDTDRVRMRYAYGEANRIFRTGYWDSMLVEARELKLQKTEGQILNNLGFIYGNYGDFARELELCFSSLRIFEEIEDQNGIASSLNNIGYIYSNQGDYENTLKYYRKCYSICLKTGETLGLAYSLNNLGFVFQKTNKPDSAIWAYKESLEKQKSMDASHLMHSTLNNIGISYRTKSESLLHQNGHPDSVSENMMKAVVFHSKALEISRQKEDKEGIALSLNYLASIHYKLKDFTLAGEYGNLAMEVAMDLGYPEIIRGVSKFMQEDFRRQGKWQEALESYELYILMRDSIKNESTEKASIRQETKYEFEKAQLIKEQEKREMQRKTEEAQKRRDNLQYSIIIIVMVMLTISVLALGRINISVRAAEGLIFFTFLLFFEFMLVLADPYIEVWSGGAPGIKLLFNAAIAALIFPLHSLIERSLKKRLASNQASYLAN
ncbi:MAG: tetratricopeptide repeat protein [Flavobacteriales bacterium]|nr:tetratricopeptide repeat protein [Flavobacteriales bacterium]